MPSLSAPPPPAPVDPGTVIVGIDPGLANLGWGAIRVVRGIPHHLGHGHIVTEPGGDEYRRAMEQIRAVRRLLLEYRAAVVGIEAWNYYTKQVTTAAHQLGLVIGGILASSPVPVHSAGMAAEWRKSLGLSIRADKGVVQVYVQERLRLAKVPRPQHASDALAVALATIPKL